MVDQFLFESRKEALKIKIQPLPNNSWRVHGKVFDQKNEPVNDVTIFFSDDKKNWVREIGNVCTDEMGYFSLKVDEKLIDSIAKKALYLSISNKIAFLTVPDS